MRSQIIFILIHSYLKLMHKQPEIAILTQNMLMGLGLKSIIEKIIPIANIEIFQSFNDLVESEPGRFRHYFVSFHLFCESRAFFVESRAKTILMIDDVLQQQNQEMTTINMNQSEEMLVCSILKLHEKREHHPHTIAHTMGHNMAHTMGHNMHSMPVNIKPVLSTRESEVLRFIVKGYINKEIANMMHISVTTVISHRKNIVAKLAIKSVAGLTIYAIANGYVSIDSL